MPTREAKLAGRTLTLDARPDRLDLRDRAYLPPVRSLPGRYPSNAQLEAYLSAYLKADLILDQGREGACTGYGLAAVINYLLFRRALEEGNQKSFAPVSPRMLYELARLYDEWDGEDYDGSSCRGAMKGWHKHGVCRIDLWQPKARKLVDAWELDAASRPLGVYYRVDKEDISDVQAALSDVGAVYCSASVHQGWNLKGTTRRRTSFSVDRLPQIEFDRAQEPAILGAHAFALVGYTEQGFVVQNSWGRGWGQEGMALLRYEDWYAHALDAWVCAMGAPWKPAPAHGTGRSSSMRLGTGQSLQSSQTIGRAGFGRGALAPFTEEQALQHSIVTGDDGVVRRRHVALGDPAAIVRDLAFDRPLAWLRAQGGRPRLMVYAHGGLNPEAESIRRVQAVGPYVEANHIYPLYLTWRTGLLETLGQQLQDIGERQRGVVPAAGWISDAKDALIEVAARKLRWVWSEMKDNAAQSGTVDGRGLTLLVDNLLELRTQLPKLEIHLVGHSAGSILHGYLLERAALKGLEIASVTLLAPACTVDFALNTYRKAIQQGRLARDKFWMHVLSVEREQRDTVIGIYGKSLLYLVDRVLEVARKTPLAGLQRVLDGGANGRDDDLWAPEFFDGVLAWRGQIVDLPKQIDGRPACEILDQAKVSDGQKPVDSAHGSFDNDVQVMTRTLNRMLGRSPDSALDQMLDDLGF